MPEQTTVWFQSIRQVLLKALSVLLCMLTISTVGVFQLIAWGTMLPSYSIQTGSWNQALMDTFSGKKPCQLCKAVQETRQEEEQNRPRTNQLKLEFACSKRVESMVNLTTRSSESSLAYFTTQARLPSRWMNGVETPPPELG